MNSAQFDPYSPNAMFSRILERLDQQDVQSREHRQDIKASISQFQAEVKSIDARTTTLERSAWKQRGAVAVIALLIPVAWQWLTSKP